MRIQVGVDDSKAGRAALRWALRLAERSGAGVEAVRSWTYSASPVTHLEAQEVMDRRTEAELASTVAHEAGPDNTVGITVLRGPAQSSLLGLIDRRKPSMVVVGRRGDERLAPRVLGSVSRRLVDTVPCPLIVVSSDGYADNGVGPRTGDATPLFLVAFDGSADSWRALTWAGELAQAARANVLIAHVVGTVGMVDGGVAVTEGTAAMVEAAAAQLAGQGVDCSTLTVVGDPRRSIEQIADDNQVDLIVVGPRGKGGLTKLVLGTVAAYLTEHADQPVAVVPATWSSDPD